MKIVVFYDNEQYNKQNRGYYLACTNKIDYFVEVLNKNNEEVEIISPAMAHSGEWFYPNTEYRINDKTKVQLFATSGKRNVFSKIFNRISLRLNLFFYLLKHTNKGELVHVYHSPFIIRTISLAKRIKKFGLLLEVEELYGDVWAKKGLKEKELKYVQIADKYMFPTNLLNEKINVRNKPYVISYGTYKVEPQIVEKYNDGKIHLVYAGTFNTRKGGALNTVKIAKYLSEKYVIHIIGFGNKKDTDELIINIDEANKTNSCKIIYDGSRRGREYIKYIQKCNIGLSTQNPEGDYNDTSFPSKILSYMANGLKVLSVSIPVVESASLGNNVYTYKDIDEKIVSIIKKMDFSEDPRERIDNLSKTFNSDYISLIKNK